jgi:tetratricopeptide (TPR) repeat protein
MKIKLALIFFTLHLLSGLVSQEKQWLKEIKNQKPDTNTIKAYIQLFRFYASQKPDLSLQYCKEGIKTAQSIHDEYGEAQLVCALGTLHFRTVQIDSALLCFNKVLPVFIRLNKKFDQANVYRQMGMVADYNAEYESATQYYLKAIKIAETINHLKIQASCLGNLGILHERLGHQKEALNYYWKCEKLFIKSNDSISLPMVYTNIGNVFDNLKLFDSCLFYYFKAEIIAKKMNHVPMLALINYNIGNIHHQQGRHAQAYEYFKTALRINEELNERDNIIGCYMQIGNVLTAMKKFSEALPYLEKSLQLAKEADYKAMISKNYEVLAGFYADQGKFDKAYQAQKLFITSRDSFLNEENQNNMANLEKKYESEKKQHQIDVLNKENQLKNAEVTKQNIFKYAFAIGFVLMGGLAFSIFRGLMAKKKANELITKQKELVEEKQKEILDSIHYARRIQKALITSEFYINKELRKIKS